MAEACAYGMFMGNLIFEGIAFGFAFVIMPRLAINPTSVIGYILASGIAGAFTFALSHEYI